jgi:hypothetical protein
MNTATAFFPPNSRGYTYLLDPNHQTSEGDVFLVRTSGGNIKIVKVLSIPAMVPPKPDAPFEYRTLRHKCQIAATKVKDQLIFTITYKDLTATGNCFINAITNFLESHKETLNQLVK